MIADGRVANGDWYQRDLSTARVRKHREERRAADEGAGSPGGDDPAPERAQGAETEVKRDETEVKRSETPETQKNKSKSKTPPPYPPAAEGRRWRQGARRFGDAARDARWRARWFAAIGSRAQEAKARPGHSAGDHGGGGHHATRAVRRIRPRTVRPKPPRWAREERDRIWRQIKQQRNARSATRAA
jgi:hypothetical protein